MTQENIKDLCSRLPYGVIVDTPKGKGHACDINFTIFGVEIGVNINTTVRDTFSINDVKPYLRPMSSMTEEQYDQLYIDSRVKNDSIDILDALANDMDAIDWLNKNHFDYRGLIEKGLAIDATNLNIY